MGQTDANGNFEISPNSANPVLASLATMTSASVGTWIETWSLGTSPATATPVGANLNFTVYALNVFDPLTVTPPVFVTQAALPDATVGSAYSQTITATGTGTDFLVATGSTLPAGLTLSSAGVLSGTPTAAGNYSFAIIANAGAGVFTTQTFTLTVAQSGAVTAPTFYTTSLPNATAGEQYLQVINVTGGTGTLNFTVNPPSLALTQPLPGEGYLPTGLILSPGGILTGTPITAGTYNFTVTVTDSAGNTASQAFTLIVGGASGGSGVVANAFPLTFTTTSLSNATVGTDYSQTISATGGSGTLTYAVTSGTLPDGLLALPDGNNIDIDGTPTTAGTYNFTVTVTDSAGNTASQAFTLTVNAASNDGGGGGGGGYFNGGGVYSGGGGGIVNAQVAGAQIFQGLQMPAGYGAQTPAADLTQYHIGNTYYGYSPSTGQLVAFANMQQLLVYFPGGINPNAAVLPAGVDVTQANAAPGTLISGAILSNGAGLQMPAGYSDPPVQPSTAGASTAAATYTVKKGDTLFSIAQKVYGKGNGKQWRQILSANPNCLSIPGNTKTLKIGFTLTIPQM